MPGGPSIGSKINTPTVSQLRTQYANVIGKNKFTDAQIMDYYNKYGKGITAPIDLPLLPLNQKPITPASTTKVVSSYKAAFKSIQDLQADEKAGQIVQAQKEEKFKTSAYNAYAKNKGLVDTRPEVMANNPVFANTYKNIKEADKYKTEFGDKDVIEQAVNMGMLFAPIMKAPTAIAGAEETLAQYMARSTGKMSKDIMSKSSTLLPKITNDVIDFQKASTVDNRILNYPNLIENPKYVYRSTWNPSTVKGYQADEIISNVMKSGKKPLTSTTIAKKEALEPAINAFTHGSNMNVGLSTSTLKNDALGLVGQANPKIPGYYVRPNQLQTLKDAGFDDAISYLAKYKVNPQSKILDANEYYVLRDALQKKGFNQEQIAQTLKDKGFSGIKKWSNSDEIQWLNPKSDLTLKKFKKQPTPNEFNKPKFKEWDSTPKKIDDVELAIMLEKNTEKLQNNTYSYLPTNHKDFQKAMSRDAMTNSKDLPEYQNLNEFRKHNIPFKVLSENFKLRKPILNSIAPLTIGAGIGLSQTKK